MSQHTYESLRCLKGQEVKDIWHTKIGKPVGLRNVTGLKNMEEIIQAILKAEADESFLKGFRARAPKQTVLESLDVETMPPKAKPGRKPKVKPLLPMPLAIARVPLEAYETTEIPLKVDEVVRVVVHKLIVENVEYFLETKTKKVFASVNGRPGHECGTWDPESRQLLES
jgi:hypothetical protein